MYEYVPRYSYLIVQGNFGQRSNRDGMNEDEDERDMQQPAGSFDRRRACLRLKCLKGASARNGHMQQADRLTMAIPS